MSCFRSIATIILLHCVIEGLTIPHRGHHKKDNIHSDIRTSHGSHLRRKQHVHVRHHSPQHATGAQRETVPSPVQDFVLLSGSPLFHERPRASDSKTNSTAAATPFAKSDQKEPPQTAANQTISKMQEQGPLSNGPVEAIQQQQHQLNTSEQHPLQEPKASSNAPPAFVQEIAQKIKEGVAAQGKDQEKLVNGTHAPTITLETPAKANSSSGIVIGLGNTSLGAKLNVDKEKTTGENASIVAISLNGHEKKPDVSGNDKTNSTSFIEIGGKENHVNASLAADVKPEPQNQKPGVGHFPFNIPGLRHYGNEKNDNKAAEAPKQITEKETKLGLHENLGPNCHWKTSKGATGALITSVSCSGEFHKPEESKGGLDEAGKKPLPGEVLKVGTGERLVGSKQINAENASVSGTGGGERKIQMQSDKEFEDEAVVTTNKFRKIHRAFPIKLNPELNREAKKYAEKIASMGSLQHDYDAVKHLDEGENLAMGCRQYGAPLTAKEAITNWYNEVCAYDFDRGEFSMSTGHFTQLAWSDSTEFGIGMARGEQNGMPCIFVVGRFKPSGNYKGEYKKNVFKGTFDPSYCDKLRDKKLL